jgi:ABC-type nitrate/sulfonate/bicarbonate transport system permease component
MGGQRPVREDDCMADRLPSQPLSDKPAFRAANRTIPPYFPILSGLYTAFIYLRSMAVFVVIWQLASLWIGNATLMPAPLTVAGNFIALAADGELLENALVSLRRLAISFFAAGAIGIPLGLLMGMSRAANDLLDPVVEMLRPISGIAWVPLGMFLLGVGDTLPIAIMFYGALFPFVVNSHAGVRAVDPRLIQVARTLGVGPAAIWRHIVLPGALPNILVGARLAAGAAWMSMVAAELIGAPSGLGFAIEWYRELLATPKVFAVIFVVGLLGYLVDRALRALQRTLTPWVPQAELAQ